MDTQDVIIRNQVKSLYDENASSTQEFFMCIAEYVDRLKNPKSNFINVNDKRAYAVPERLVADVFTKYESQVKSDIAMHMSETITEDSCIIINYSVKNPDQEYNLDTNELCYTLGESLYDDLELIDTVIHMVFYRRSTLFLKARNSEDSNYMHRYVIKIYLRTSLAYVAHLCKKYSSENIIVKPVVQAYLHGSFEYGEAKHETLGTKSFIKLINENTGKVSTRVNDVAIDNAHEFSINYEKHIIKKPQCAPVIELEATGDTSELVALSSILDIKQFGSSYEATYIREMLAKLDISLMKKYEVELVLKVLKSLNPMYKKLAMEWLMRNNVWNKAEFKKQWNKPIGSKSYSLGLICNYLSKQDPAAYNAIRNNTALTQCMKFLMRNGGVLTDSNRTLLIKNLWGHMYKTASIQVTKTKTEKVLCRLNLGTLKGTYANDKYLCKWQINCDNSHLRDVIEHDLYELTSRARMCFSLNKNPTDAKGWEKFLSNINATKLRLENYGLIKNTEAFLRDKIYEENLLEDMDKNPKLIGVRNGVLDLRGEEPVLITEAHPFKISKTCDADYVPYDPEDKYIKRLEKAFKEIIPEQSAYEEIIMIAASTLCPETPMMFLMQLYGGGRNGKTTIVELVLETLGDYGVVGESSVFTGMRPNASGPDSQVLQYRNARLISYSESNAGEQLQDGQLKKIVNNAKVAPRGLFETEHTKFQVMARFMYTSNNPFIVNTTDDGTWRRIRVYRAKVKFTENPASDKKYEKKINSKIENYKNKKKYRQAMFSLLVHWVMIFKNKYKSNFSSIRSDVITADTESYQIAQDKISLFLRTRVLRVKNVLLADQNENARSEPYSISDIVNLYMEWYKLKHGTLNIPPSLIESQFENSMLKGHLLPDEDTGISYLDEMKFRILETGKHRISSNEEYLFKRTGKK